jgi:ubiquinone/menaquinone biosynthesis C-methylase UbiE
MSGWKKKRAIMQRYNVTADIYDMRYADEQTAKYEAALESLRTRKFSIILDAGCGTGLFFDHVADKTGAIIGLDISRKSLLKARKRAKFQNVHIVCADVDAMPLVERIFDHVFAMTLIQNSPNPVDTLKEIERVSKNNAEIVVTGLKKVFSKEKFEELLRNAGLKIVVLKNEDNLKCYVTVCRKLIIKTG